MVSRFVAPLCGGALLCLSIWAQQPAAPLLAPALPAPKPTTFVALKTIQGQLSPKSVVHSGNGLFFAQNMMYNHTITVYDRQFRLVKTIRDEVRFADYGYTWYDDPVKGAPVEAAFSHGGKYAWVSNYEMYSPDFTNPGTDNCKTSSCYDNGFVYKINTSTYKIEQVMEVGAVPKYVAVTPDSRYVLVSNWCSGDLSVIDTRLGCEVKMIPLGLHPRGIVVDKLSQKAYIAIMGSSRIAVVDLKTFKTTSIKGIGITPRHLVLDPINNRYLYATMNNEGKVIKIDLTTGKVVSRCATGKAPRSMVGNADGRYLYVVNYLEDSLAKVRTADMKVVEKVATNHHPIGITFDALESTVWVACYTGSLLVFRDTDLAKPAAAIAPAALAKPAAPLPKPAAAAPPKAAAAAASVEKDKNGFYIIVGSYETSNQAEQDWRNWQQQGYKLGILYTNNRYRLYYARYDSLTEAQRSLTTVQSTIKSDAWICSL